MIYFFENKQQYTMYPKQRDGISSYNCMHWYAHKMDNRKKEKKPMPL